MRQLPVRIICGSCAGRDGHDRVLARYGPIAGPDVVPTDRGRELGTRRGWGLTLGQHKRQRVSAHVERGTDGTPYLVATCRCGATPYVKLETIERRAADGELVIAV